MTKLTDHDIDRHVGQRIRARRHMMGLTQVDLGKALGVKFQQIQKYETGANRVSASKMFRVAETLRCDMLWFYIGLPAGYALADEADMFTALTAKERQVLEAMRDCSETTQASLVNIARAAARPRSEGEVAA
jgi:transcriptional regulator with XRE-family HTH domain